MSVLIIKKLKHGQSEIWLHGCTPRVFATDEVRTAIRESVPSEEAAKLTSATPMPVRLETSTTPPSTSSRKF